MAKLCVEKIDNGYTTQSVSDYGNLHGEPTYYGSFLEMVEKLAASYGELEFARSVMASNALTQAFTTFIDCAVKPQLLAIESKINPGIENVETEIDF